MRAVRRYSASRRTTSTRGVQTQTPGGIRARRRDIEGQHGRALVSWADCAAASRPALRYLLHVPNGGARSARTGAELKRQGVRRGVWDYLLPLPRHGGGGQAYAGLWIELKEPGERRKSRGGLSPHQIEFGHFVRSNEYATVVAYDWIEARDAITAYLDGQVVPFFWRPQG